MYRIVLVICILSLLLLQACDSASNDEQEDFSITLNLTDASGAPLSDYAVTIFQNCYQDLFRFGMAKPSTSFGLAVAEGCRADIKITDYFGNPIRNISSNLSPGVHQFVWNAKNDQDKLVRDGVYKISVDFYDAADSLVFTDYCLAYKLSEFDTDVSPFLTDSSGRVFTDDIIPYAVLYCQEGITMRDEHGSMLNTVNVASSSDSMKVVVTSPQGESKKHYFRIRNGKNVLNLNWASMLADDEENKPSLAHGASTSRIPSHKSVLDTLELSSFHAVENANGAVLLTWVAQLESNISGYSLYRSEVNQVEIAIIISPLIPANNLPQQSVYTFTDAEVQPEHSYYYWLNATSASGSSSFFGPVSVTTSAQDPPPLPTQNSLSPNYPNPFN